LVLAPGLPGCVVNGVLREIVSRKAVSANSRARDCRQTTQQPALARTKPGLVEEPRFQMLETIREYGLDSGTSTSSWPSPNAPPTDFSDHRQHPGEIRPREPASGLAAVAGGYDMNHVRHSRCREAVSVNDPLPC
jgi:hypothetical protein